MENDPKVEIERLRAESDRLRALVDQERLLLDRERVELDKQRATTDRTRLELEHYRAELDRFRAANEAARPLVEAIMRFADLTVRSLLILNGGAALALLSFSAHAGRHLAANVWWFGVGALLSVGTAALSYLAQVFLTEPKSERFRKWAGGSLRALAILAGLAALTVFGVAVWKVSSNMQSLPHP